MGEGESSSPGGSSVNDVLLSVGLDSPGGGKSPSSAGTSRRGGAAGGSGGITSGCVQVEAGGGGGGCVRAAPKSPGAGGGGKAGASSVSVLQLAFITFFTVAGGPYGFEECVGAAGGWAVLVGLMAGRWKLSGG